MNLLHHHHHVYFQLRERDSPNYALINEKAWLMLRMRCKPESEWDRGRGVTVAVAARDRIITFGKYKGKMLGSVPSRYLKWVCNNLRAGHFEEWAKLADQVLQDPIYRDRIEWELALNVLNGDNLNLPLRAITSSSTAVSQLLDISDRFGWDNQDKVGWGKVDFDLLGTSKGGRIPRRLVTHTQQPKDPHPPTSASTSITLNDDNKSRTTRMQRRERQKNLRLRTQAQALRQQEENKKKNVDDFSMDSGDDGGGGDGEMVRQNQNQNQNHSQKNAIANPFPGRQALLPSYHRAQTHKHKI